MRNAEAIGGKNVSHFAFIRIYSHLLALWRSEKGEFSVAFWKECELTTLSGSEFQTVGAETEKARLAKTAVEFEERSASVCGLTAVVERGRVVYTSSDWRWAGVDVDLAL